MAFRSHHVPQGVIKLKKKEFQDLKQGSMTASEYVTHFMQLSCYTPNDVDTDEKKQECFLNGRDDGCAYALEARDFEFADHGKQGPCDQEQERNTGT
jgi:hypothetical protein